MANENIGKIGCPFCMGDAFVRANAKGKKYIFCEEDGIIQPTKINFQNYIKENAEMYGEPEAGYQGGNAEAAPEPEQAAAPEPQAVEIVQQGDDFNSWMET